MTPALQSHQETDWLAQLKDWLRKRPMMAIIVEVDSRTGEVQHVRAETVETAAALLDTVNFANLDELDEKEE